MPIPGSGLPFDYCRGFQKPEKILQSSRSKNYCLSQEQEDRFAINTRTPMAISSITRAKKRVKNPA
jgi:hypothetical protein